VQHADSSRRLVRGADHAKDQSYVLYVLSQAQLARTLLPVGDLTKDEVRAEADRLGLRTAAKPDSQDVCFITSSAGRAGFLSRRLDLHPAQIVDDGGRQVGEHEAVELVTLGQRRGLGLAGGGAEPRYVVGVDVAERTVRVGSAADLLVDEVRLESMVWSAGDPPPTSAGLAAQCSAHGDPRPAVLTPQPGDHATVRFAQPERRVAVGQSVVLYAADEVVAGGIVVA
jgi:tRNA-specific 2-thiouridylase